MAKELSIEEIVAKALAEQEEKFNKNTTDKCLFPCYIILFIVRNNLRHFLHSLT